MIGDGADPGWRDTAPVDVDLDVVWAGVAGGMWQRRTGFAERTAAWLLRSPGLARALVTTPSLLLPWLVATVVVIAAGALIRFDSGQPLVWVLTPALAAAGVAYVYGPGMDPAWELCCSMAVSDRMVLLVRAMAVFAVNAALGLVASAASGAVAALTFGWLVPMAAVCAFALAVATLTRSASAGAVAGVASWVITLLSARVAGGQLTTAVTSSVLVMPYLAVAACCIAVAVFATRIPRGLS